MILVDSSAWIELDRATGSPVHVRLRAAITNGEVLATTGLVVVEVLAGARYEREERDLAAMLFSCTYLALEEPDDLEAAAALYRTCRRAGTTVRKLNDCVIATVAIRNEVELLHHDADFDAIAQHAPLSVVAV